MDGDMEDDGTPHQSSGMHRNSNEFEGTGASYGVGDMENGQNLNLQDVNLTGETVINDTQGMHDVINATRDSKGSGRV